MAESGRRAADVTPHEAVDRFGITVATMLDRLHTARHAGLTREQFERRMAINQRAGIPATEAIANLRRATKAGGHDLT